MTKLSRMVGLCTLAAAIVAQPIAAQQQDSLFPHRGTWGAELVSTAGGAVLRFVSPRRAWVAGMDFSAQHTDRPPASGGVTTGALSTNLRVQLGHRWYRSAAGDNGRRLRPIVGLGVVGTYSRVDVGDSFDYQWAGGGYGEVGATWFFSPHFSAGAVSLLQATMGQRRQTVSTLSPVPEQIFTTQTFNVWTVNANLVRALVTVYF